MRSLGLKEQGDFGGNGMISKEIDVAIIGAGPAGMAASIKAKELFDRVQRLLKSRNFFIRLSAGLPKWSPYAGPRELKLA